MLSVWSTGHEIADTVAKHIEGKHFHTSKYKLAGQQKVNVGYGILRGMNDVFRESEAHKVPWFNIDRGYIYPDHYNGYYRISLRGTQYTGPIQSWMLDRKRMDQHGVMFSKWRGLAHHKPVLICPPTEFVKRFFNDITGDAWLKRAVDFLAKQGIDDYEIREKKTQNGLVDFHAYNFVLTFNSSLGWKALRSGIPCLSDPVHSFVGAYSIVDFTELDAFQKENREDMFAVMANLQMTLTEMREGKAWELISRFI